MCGGAPPRAPRRGAHELALEVPDGRSSSGNDALKFKWLAGISPVSMEAACTRASTPEPGAQHQSHADQSASQTSFLTQGFGAAETGMKLHRYDELLDVARRVSR
eukprot:6214597-Pleurochrysis_carterae.AAC.2